MKLKDVTLYGNVLMEVTKIHVHVAQGVSES